MSCVNEYSTPESILCRSGFGSDYSFESSWLYLHQLCISGFGDFLPFFIADLLKLCQVGWGISVNCNFQDCPQILNGIQVWALAGAPKDFHILVLKPFRCCVGCMLGVIVLLERKSSPQSKDFALWSRFSSSICLYLSPFIVPSLLTSLPVPTDEKHPP